MTGLDRTIARGSSRLMMSGVPKWTSKTRARGGQLAHAEIEPNDSSSSICKSAAGLSRLLSLMGAATAMIGESSTSKR
jgi:hypothetical protein